MNRVGSAFRTSARSARSGPARRFSRTDSGAPGADDDIVTTVTNETVYVDVAC